MKRLASWGAVASDSITSLTIPTPRELSETDKRLRVKEAEPSSA